MAHPERKTLQLCRQVEEALSLTLASEDDDILLSLSILSVQPAPDASRLLVMFHLSETDSEREELSRDEVLEYLNGFKALFRDELADSIHRRRLPELVFRVVKD